MGENVTSAHARDELSFYAVTLEPKRDVKEYYTTAPSSFNITIYRDDKNVHEAISVR